MIINMKKIIISIFLLILISFKLEALKVFVPNGYNENIEKLENLLNQAKKSLSAGAQADANEKFEAAKKILQFIESNAEVDIRSNIGVRAFLSGGGLLSPEFIRINPAQEQLAVNDLKKIIKEKFDFINSQIFIEKKESDKDFRLPKLSDKDLEAGLHTDFYKNVSREEWKMLHEQGNYAPVRFLVEHIFFNTIFIYYTYLFLSFDLTFDYYLKGIEIDPSIATSKFRELSVVILGKIPALFHKGKYNKEAIAKEISNILPIDSIHKAIESFKTNKLLIDLAIAYLRTKIVIEKLTNKVVQTSSEQIVELLYQQDRLNRDLQTMIFHMMKEAYEQYKEKLAKAETDQDKLKAGDFLAKFEPSWKDKPYYSAIIKQLRELIKPKFSIEGIKL